MIVTTVALLLAVAASVLLHVGARRAVSALNPAVAVWMVTGGSLLTSLALGLTLTAVGLAVAGRAAPIAAIGHWSAPVLTVLVPVPTWLGIVAAVCALAFAASALVRSIRIVAMIVRGELVARRLRAGGGPLIVLADDTVDAYTIAGLRGCVVIGAALLGSIDEVDRRVLVAHELSHLTRRHHLYVHVADLAAAANPLLRTIPDAVRLGIERIADEDAVKSVGGDRRAVALALAHVADVRRRGPASAGTVDDRHQATLAMAASHLARRVTALSAGPIRARVTVLAVVAILVTGAAAAASTVSAAQIHNRMEIAQQDLATHSTALRLLPDHHRRHHGRPDGAPVRDARANG